MNNKINKTVLVAAIIALSAHAHADSLTSSSQTTMTLDPFVKTWKNFDGMNTYQLSIRHPDQDYSINYNFPNGSAGSDVCQVTSDTSLSCASGDTVTRNDAQHSIKVTSPYNQSYVYYDSEHMPSLPAIMGRWTYGQYSLTITTPLNGATNTYDVLTAANQDYCIGTTADEFSVTNNSDGTQLFTHQNQFGAPDVFLYDSAKNEIRNPHPGKYFHVGTCISIYFDKNIIFKK